MDHRITEYSVGELARLSGVTVRTLHHYDAIGLLRPAHVALNGYRSYGRAEALRLQEILFYRAFGLSLTDIAEVLSAQVDPIARLTAHRDKLAEEARRVERLLETLDATILSLKGKHNMQDRELYTPFDAATQTAHETWLIDTYGPDMAASISTSKQAISEMAGGLAAAMTRLKSLETALVALFNAGHPPDVTANHTTLDSHRALIAELWGRDCPPAAYAGLAQLYQSHPDFIARYERLAPRFSSWLPEAMIAYAKAA